MQLSEKNYTFIQKMLPSIAEKIYLCTRLFTGGKTKSSLVMDPLIQYSLPVKGLRPGTHQFDFHIESEFFSQFEDSPVSDGNINLTLVFDKRPNLFVLQFDFAGTIKAECDRCLEMIDLPVADSQQLLVKFSEEQEAEDADVIYIHPETQHFNVATYIYEYVILAMPIRKVYDCENDKNAQCNQEMLKYIRQEVDELPPVAEEKPSSNPLWDQLKNLNVEDN